MKKYKISIENKLISGSMNIELSEQEVKDLIEQYNKPTHKRKYFVPKDNEMAYYIDNTNEQVENFKFNVNKTFSEFVKSIGNCFATEQDAQDELNRRQALVRIWNNYDDKYSWDIDWEDNKQIKHGIALNHFRGIPNVQAESTVYQYSTELPYFKSAEDRNQFVEDNKEDLLVVFNIKK